MNNQLDQLRYDQSMTFEELADKSGLNKNTVYRYIRGFRSGASYNTVERIANALGYDLVLRKRCEDERNSKT